MAKDTLAAAPALPSIEGLEQVLINGDLSALSPAQAVTYYQRVCESVGLNPLTQPFEYLQLSGRMVLYARRAASEQLRRIHSVSVAIVHREVIEGCLMVTARATLPSGRCDEDVGSVPIAGLRGEALANATMKAITKAKRRVTLGICGLAFLDESELDGVRGATPVPMPVLAAQPQPQHTPPLALVVGELEAGEPEGEELTKDEAQTTAQTFGGKLRALRTQAELVSWLADVIRHDFAPPFRKTLWRMLQGHCVALKQDANLILRLAEAAAAKGKSNG